MNPGPVRNTLLTNAAVIKAEQLGHDLEWDPPAILTSCCRWTCKRCGSAALVNDSVAYGSALTVDCTTATERRAS